MSVEKLRAEINEYHMRIEEVLNGMDGVLTSLSNRLGMLEQRVEQLGQKSPTQYLSLPESEQLLEIREQIETLTSAVHALLVEDD
ncbi:hypothetical protein [Vogesella indigofera]|uniref:hypothetical protein n=1 Tax=Vogesella indigofera TaxID=45465 RepID=UPI00234EC139|nr:hypothetical protein [Vogesella indigofera]MDC7706559.1 hypothetical protein [Vogesella indigofera]